MSTSNMLSGNFDDSEDEDDNFNPAPADISDDENANDDDAPEDQAQNEVAKRTMTSTREDYEEDEEEEVPGNTRDGADDDEDEEGEGIDVAGGGDDEEDEEDDEEDEDEEEVQGHRRKRHRRDRRNQFLDVEAEVDEDEDEADEDEDELHELNNNFIIADTHPDDLADLPVGGGMDDRGHREVDRMREREMHMDAEKQAEMLKKKYAKSRSAHANADYAIIPKRLLLPSVQDPSIWAVKCKEGKEKEVVFSIMRRIEEVWGTRDELAITSAFERGGPNAPMKGHVYIEARSQADILKALGGIMHVYPRTKMHLVEIKEMPDLLRVTKTAALEPGTYVRMKRAPYAGDLAQIIDVTENGLEVRLRVVPRLDYGLNEDQHPSGEKRKRIGPAVRPPPRLFSEVEARKRHMKHLSGNAQTKSFIYKGEDYINGYLEKDVKIQNLVTKDVNPTLEEVTRFASGGEDGAENLDLNALAASLKASSASATYLPGDVIEVYEGEQKGLSGKAVTVQSDIVTLAVTEGPLKGQSIEVPVKGLRKKFAEGDHVKVIGGSSYRDEVGMVVAIVDDRVTFLSDQNHSEITVFSKDLREASDSGGAGSLGQYVLFDLVQLDPATVACIVKIDRESMIVLDQNSQVRTIMPTQISNKIDKRRHAAAADRNGNEIHIDDSVKEYGGESKVGKILHIHRSYLFLHSIEQNENAGIFVARITGVTSMSAKGARGPAGPDLTAMNPALQRAGAGGAASLMPPPRIPMHRDRSIGQTVTIRKGPHKGLLGIVKDATDTQVRVELHTKAKVVTVAREQVAFKDKYTGAAIDPNARGGRGGGGRGGGRGGGATPGGWEGGRTPAPGMSGRTPAWGNRTPAPMNGGRTPAWQQSGGRTPAWNDGSRTAIPGDRTAYGGRTPAWAAGGKTPAYDGFNTGSKTPAYGGGDSWGSKTPAHPSSGGDNYSFGSNVGASNVGSGNSWSANANSSANASAPTPSATTSAAYDAPTPAAGAHSAPTPAAMNAPTPGAYSAPTPAASAPTPAANGWSDYGASAPTPGASGLAAPTPGASWGGGGYVGAPTPVGYGQAETPAAWAGNDGDIGYADE